MYASKKVQMQFTSYAESHSVPFLYSTNNIDNHIYLSNSAQWVALRWKQFVAMMFLCPNRCIVLWSSSQIQTKLEVKSSARLLSNSVLLRKFGDGLSTGSSREFCSKNPPTFLKTKTLLLLSILISLSITFFVLVAFTHRNLLYFCVCTVCLRELMVLPVYWWALS